MIKEQKTLKKTISFGEIDYNQVGKKLNLVEVEIELKNYPNKPEFTASANVWNSRKSDILMGWQCLDDIASFITDDNFSLILDLWHKHHLNDLNAGTMRQEKEVSTRRLRFCSKKCQELFNDIETQKNRTKGLGINATFRRNLKAYGKRRINDLIKVHLASCHTCAYFEQTPANNRKCKS